MSPDGKPLLNDLEIKILKKRSDSLLNAGDVLQPAWIRRAVQTSDGLDRFLLDYGFTVLPRIGFFFWVVFLIQKAF